ncbi:MAG: hypothetical protein Q8P06_01870 [Candidatus Azambacteria bacterium]|nr:hypothetical protein [Candidatus Azambacteria bacterium]
MQNYNSKFKIFILIAIIALIAIIFVAFYFYKPAPPNTALDEFAQCLAAKDITMYGAAWCSHCQNEKKSFGDSFKFVPYVECPDNTQICLEKGINGYPTWIFPDDRKLVGEQGLKKLSQKSGCPLPTDY